MIKANATVEPVWHILGAGSIGKLLATRFSDAGLAVTLVRRPQSKPVREVIALNRTQRQSTKRYELNIESANHSGAIDFLLVTTKSNQVRQALTDVLHRIGPHSKILLLHNGMGTLDEASSLCADSQLYCGVTTQGAYQRHAQATTSLGLTKTKPIEPHQLVYAGTGDTRIGQLGCVEAPARVQPLLHSDIDFAWDNNIGEALWMKLLVNCAINPLTAIHNCPNGHLLTNPGYRRELSLLVAELAEVATGIGYPALAEQLPGKVEQVLQLTQHNFASMQQDIAHERATEIDYINGYLCKQAKLYAVAAPRNEALVAAIKQKEKTPNA